MALAPMDAGGKVDVLKLFGRGKGGFVIVVHVAKKIVVVALL